MSCNCNDTNSRRRQIENAIRSGVRKALKTEKSSSNDIKNILREAVREVLSEDGDDYQEFVKGVMETLNIDSPQDLTEEGRSEFFDLVGRNYDEETDTADDIPMEEIKNVMSPDHYENQSDVPDFLKKQDEEVVRENVRNALQKLLR
jgi:hypothetical protein